MILVVVEYAKGVPAKSTLEMIRAAQQSGVEGPIAALVLGSGVDAVASATAKYVEQVLVADRPELATYDAELWSAAVAQIAAEGEAQLILISGSRSGREFSPYVAVKLDAALLEDVISIQATGNLTRAQHYTFLSRVTETIEAEGTVVATVKPGAFEPAKPGTAASEQFDVDIELPKRRVQITGSEIEKASRVSLTEADIIVAGGRGLGTAETYTQLIDGLADQLGAAVGATRAVVDAAWRPYSEQVGQTGKTVQPKLYLAVGISGAVQHLSGMNKSKFIVAINKDPEAPIFTIADFGVVGDAAQVVPALIGELQKP